MIDKIKIYIMAFAIVVLATSMVMTKHELYSVEKEYKTYKDNINAQLNRAILEKTRIEAEQKAKYDKAKSDYDTDMARLTDALERMRKSGTVPREGSMPVAGGRSDSVSGKAENPSGTTEGIEIEACVKRSAFFALALHDTLQCSRLMELVKP